MRPGPYPVPRLLLPHAVRQGPNANGGAREYFKDGVLTEGFAGIAWPADYGSSGVMTFIVNADGVVFQKDLGEDTATLVEDIKSFDPDSSWTAIVPPEVTTEMAARRPDNGTSFASNGGGHGAASFLPRHRRRPRRSAQNIAADRRPARSPGATGDRP